MKKILVFLLILMFACVGYFVFFYESKEIVNYPSNGETIVAFGDSLVEGVGSTVEGGFVTMLSEKIDTPIINLGKSGDTTIDGLKRIDEVLDKNPKIVLVLLGGNDYLRKIPQEETFANLEKIITTIQKEGSMVILLGVRGGVIKDDYKDDFESLAKKLGTAYVPNVLDGLFANPEFMSDTIHPNDEGYKMIADKIYPVVTDLLE